jgi:hypothetical protein
MLLSVALIFLQLFKTDMFKRRSRSITLNLKSVNTSEWEKSMSSTVTVEDVRYILCVLHMKNVNLFIAVGGPSLFQFI